jgi:hypothetical protein
MASESPWMNASEAGRYVKRGRRFVLKEISAGRLQGARIGGRGENSRREWLDIWVEAQSKPVLVQPRKRA